MYVSLLNLYFHRIQPNVIFGLFGLPCSWLDVLSMDLNIGGLVSQRTKSYVSIFETFLAFVRPTLPMRCPSWLRDRFPLVAWSLYGDDATVSPEPLLKKIAAIYNSGEIKNELFFLRTRPEILLFEPPRRFGSATAQTKARIFTIT